MRTKELMAMHKQNFISLAKGNINIIYNSL